ncbi:hypothetical protein Anapl_07003 [Anas platyrhynchos]|uniref:Uncharacterized protein n=1 Tax=Anas platyrhynchos TaxID=8839 RepID=R0KDR4_ANAPL|nr:hypothetical protein Anapl_07003 [Anas platyrhynchos]
MMENNQLQISTLVGSDLGYPSVPEEQRLGRKLLEVLQNCLMVKAKEEPVVKTGTITSKDLNYRVKVDSSCDTADHP